MRSVAIILNPEKGNAIELARELVPWFEERGVLVMAEHDAATAMRMARLSRDEGILATADFALVMGGDGTLLRASRMMAPHGVPMLAVRFGKFGFLSDTEPAGARDALAAVLEGRYRTDERMMLQAAMYRSGRRLSRAVALNDVVVAKGPLARMLRLGTCVSGKFISTYAADGLIVATPTGSTAYSLSAGGPLVAPDLKVFIITPICPHTLNARSLIIPSRQTVDVVVESDPGDVVTLTVDGQLGVPLEPGDKISVREARFKAKLISVDGPAFFDKLQTRLRWGDRFDT
ncbi:MAG TPA: NAD(+)/NADH kinase [Armatimonadota bacterium]|nr:NAD(+)/NADH kinase [Armatimonadota bacterium]